MRKHKSENLLEYCVFYKDRELPALHKTEKLKKALILDSLKDQEHPLNQLIDRKQAFVPFINERDNMGRLITSESYHRKRKSDVSSLFNSPKDSHNHLLSKNSISNTCSICDNQLPAARLKLKNLLGGTPENTELFQSTLLASQSEFKQSFQFNSKCTQVRQKKHHSIKNKLPSFIKESRNPEFKIISQPTTPLAVRIFQSNFVIEKFNQNKQKIKQNRISNSKMNFILIFEKICDLQVEFLKTLNANERRRTFIKLDNNRRLKLSVLLLISRQTSYRILQ